MEASVMVHFILIHASDWVIRTHCWSSNRPFPKLANHRTPFPVKYACWKTRVFFFPIEYSKMILNLLSWFVWRHFSWLTEMTMFITQLGYCCDVLATQAEERPTNWHCGWKAHIYSSWCKNGFQRHEWPLETKWKKRKFIAPFFFWIFSPWHPW